MISPSVGCDEKERLTIRFAGDSGDGMQLTGAAFTRAVGAAGHVLSTLQDFPAEIRAPAGSVAGVSAFQICFSCGSVTAASDRPDVLVAMNPAALKANVADVAPDATIVVNEDAFTTQGLAKAGYDADPLADGSLRGFRSISVPMTTLTVRALDGLDLTKAEAHRTKNFFALGVALWLCERDPEPVVAWIATRFRKKPAYAEANRLATLAGFDFGETAELAHVRYRVLSADLPPGTYRLVSGNEAVALGAVAASVRSGRDLFYASYPITPASEILQYLASYQCPSLRAHQAEDEIAAMCAAIGAAYGGALGMTGTSGPGLSLKAEAIGLAVIAELPCVIVDVQRAGPSTGMPTKTEQSDLLAAVFGRHGESPVPVLAAASPADCFETTLEAWRIALRHMTPVLLLSDSYLSSGAEPWRIPRLAELPDLSRLYRLNPPAEAAGRDETTLAPAWIVPGAPGLARTTGGLERHATTGRVTYAPDNHHEMTLTRAEKIARVADDLPPLEVHGADEGDLLVLGWGSTFGAIRTAVDGLLSAGYRVGQAHLRYLNPMPPNTATVLARFRTVLVPEANTGQLALLLRARFGIAPVSFSRVEGRPMRAADIRQEAERFLPSDGHRASVPISVIREAK